MNGRLLKEKKETSKQRYIFDRIDLYDKINSKTFLSNFFWSFTFKLVLTNHFDLLVQRVEMELEVNIPKEEKDEFLKTYGIEKSVDSEV